MKQAGEFRRIVLPLDGSELAERAVPIGERLAAGHALPIHLLRVADLANLPELGSAGGSELVAREFVAAEAMAREYLARVAAWLVGRGCVVTTEVRRGGAIRQLLAVIRAGDLVVLGARGHGHKEGGLGSVAAGVVGRSPAPVVVVPAAYDECDSEEPYAAAVDSAMPMDEASASTAFAARS